MAAPMRAAVPPNAAEKENIAPTEKGTCPSGGTKASKGGRGSRGKSIDTLSGWVEKIEELRARTAEGPLGTEELDKLMKKTYQPVLMFVCM